jgi:hypothetical protein
MVLVDDRCPTFTWGQVDEVLRYELVVYRVAERGRADEAPVALRATIDGRAAAWTPTLPRCLARGHRYAWSLRAHRTRSVSDWSPPAMFQVAAAPHMAEMEEAVAMMRELVEATAQQEDPVAAGESRAGDGPANAGEPPGSRDAGVLSLGVEGRIEAAAFAGDGSSLVNVEAAGLTCVGCVAGAQIADGSLTAAKIGAVCAAGQVLMRGAVGWECATLTAAACTPGDELGCYTGPAGTRGVGACAGGTRFCDGDSAWGSCSGEVLPAPAELCDGLDNTCDGTVDTGDPAALCPLTANVTATLCDQAACSIESCAADWFDADGEYANGCEAPPAGLCLHDGVPRAIVVPTEGQLVIQELLADPASPLADSTAEWFEVAVTADVDLNGLGIGTVLGAAVDSIDAADCRTAQAGDLLLFARSADPAANGGLAPQGTFSFSLVNGGGSLTLEHDGTLIDAVSWGSGDVDAGRSRNLPAAAQSSTANDDPTNWCTVPADAGLRYFDGNHGTPGSDNIACP